MWRREREIEMKKEEEKKGTAVVAAAASTSSLVMVTIVVVLIVVACCGYKLIYTQRKKSIVGSEQFSLSLFLFVTRLTHYAFLRQKN